MAPEQVAGDAIDGRTDLYALGCVLYEMLTGARAFEGPSSVVVMGKQLRETPRPPRVRAPAQRIPAALEAVVVRAMAKKPEERFASAEAMRAALEETRTAPERRRARTRRIAAWMMTGACMLGAAGASAAWSRAHASAIAPGPVVLAAAPTPVATPVPVVPTSTSTSTSTSTPTPTSASTPTPTPPATPVPLREARAAARAHPGDPRALELWARSALRAGDFREARRAAAAWSLHDGTVEPRLAMADILEASGRRADARAVLQEWLETHPDSADARASLAHLAGEGGTRELARR
jgi:serine/threonine-protein kinase